jgi:hypothetical protein
MERFTAPEETATAWWAVARQASRMVHRTGWLALRRLARIGNR